MIVDSFMFYNELDVLEWRLRALDPYVDLFVLVESEVSHIGLPKELYFEKNKERFSQWISKIRHVVARDMPTDENPWSREKYQRHCILNGLQDIPDDAHVMISDVDEIPDMSRLEPWPIRTISIHVHMFEYSFDYTFTGEPWFGTVVTNIKSFKKLGPNFFRDNRWRFPYIINAGWHLSSFGDAEHVLKKLKTYAHAKDQGRHEHQTLDDVRAMLENGMHHSGGKLQKSSQTEIDKVKSYLKIK
jgi:beta-1,4-mannosyl-glycoprotein beta-1,4-N-acetylglucosaminyltransferase